MNLCCFVEVISSYSILHFFHSSEHNCEKSLPRRTCAPLQSLLHKSQEPVQKAINFAGRKAGCSPQPLQASRREHSVTAENNNR
jgi:hypothetical protein